MPRELENSAVQKTDDSKCYSGSSDDMERFFIRQHVKNYLRSIYIEKIFNRRIKPHNNNGKQKVEPVFLIRFTYPCDIAAHVSYAFHDLSLSYIYLSK